MEFVEKASFLTARAIYGLYGDTLAQGEPFKGYLIDTW